MNKWLPALAATLSAGCGATYITQDVEAVQDLIAVSEAKEVESFRRFEDHRFVYVNDYYITVDGRSDSYLVEFKSRCRALRRKGFTPDMVDYRRDANYISAKFDTYRGCRIGKIFEIDSVYLEELWEIRDAPKGETMVPVKG